MALILPGHFLYLHVPKTGGKWTKNVLRRNYPGARLLNESTHGNVWAKRGHCDLQDVGHMEPFRFAFVRHPVDFWRSFWRFRMKHTWQPGHEIDSRCMDNDFDAYVEKVLANLPGYASQMFARFVGPVEDEIEYIGRQETLVEDLREALTRAGVWHDGVDLSFGRVNAGQDATAGVAFTPQQWAALSDAESEGMERYGYA